MNGEPEQLGENGAIRLHMPEIEKAARESNGFVLEIGPGIGTGSTWAIQEGLLDHHPYPIHISVDHQDYMQWKPSKMAEWQLVIGDSRDPETKAKVYNAFYRWGISLRDYGLGLIFIDTDHTYEQMKAELAVWGDFF